MVSRVLGCRCFGYRDSQLQPTGDLISWGRFPTSIVEEQKGKAKESCHIPSRLGAKTACPSPAGDRREGKLITA